MQLQQPEQPQPAPVKLAYSYEEAAEVVGVCVETLRRAVKKGDLAYCQVGARVLLTPAQIQNWLDSKTHQYKRK